jgi:hypothetical protein
MFAPMAVAEEPTFFQQVYGQPGVVVSYDEIVAETVPVGIIGPASANGESSSTQTTTLPCIAGFEASNCGRIYDGMFAYDLNADGTDIVGAVVFPGLVARGGEVSLQATAAGPTAQLQAQAVVWKADLGGFVLLDDDSRDFALGNYGTLTGPSATEFASAAFDITRTDGTIVGMAGGTYTEGNSPPVDCDDGCAALEPGETATWLLPLIWEQTGASTWSAGQVLSMLPPGDEDSAGPVGGAYAINDLGTYIAGWNGEIESYEESGVGIVAVQAVRWRPVMEGDELGPDVNQNWVPEGLGHLPPIPGGEEYDASIANDVNDAGVVVGWSGYLDNDCSFCGPLSMIPGGSIFPSPGADWSPRPFVWEAPEPGMMPLNLHEDNVGITFPDGEARAISNGNTTAVGWVSRFGFSDGQGTADANGPFPEGATFDPDSSQDIFAAAWIHPGDPGWAENQLVVLGMTEGAFGPGGETVPDFSIANAVDASGRLIVGKVGTIDFCEGYCGQDDTAAFWELDSQGNLIRGDTVQDALRDAGVPVSRAGHETGSEQPDEGATNELHLTEATGVRMETDPQTGAATALYVIGVGQGSFGSWIANLVTPGLTTPASVRASLAVVGQGARDVTEGIGFNAENERCWRPEGESVDESPWCFFTVGRGSLYVDSGANGTAIGQQVGVARFLDEDTQVGGSFGFNHFGGTVAGGGSYEATLLGGGVYVAHEPQEGLQGVASAALGRIVDATFNRVYVNGLGTATSTGSTDGWAYSLYGKLAYSMTVKEGVRVIPFLSGTLSHSTLAGYTDTGGPFNATIAGFSTDSQVLTAGVRAEKDLTPDRMIYGELSISAVHSTSNGVNATVAGGTFSLPTPNGWGAVASVTGGIKQEFDASTNGFAQVTLSSNLGSYFSASIVGGFNKSF